MAIQEYSYQFDSDLQQEWNWTEKYAYQPKILSYVNHVADRFDLRRDISFDTRVLSIFYNETDAFWTVPSEGGQTYTTAYCIMTTGCFFVSNKPSIKGIEHFAGEIYYTGDWPHDPVDFSGKRVAASGHWLFCNSIDADHCRASRAAHRILVDSNLFCACPNAVG